MVDNERRFRNLLATVTANDPLVSRCELDGWRVGTHNIALLCQALHRNNYVTRLDLDNNAIGDNGMMVVADLIRSTTVIQRLFLFDNDITDIGCEIICDAMSQNTSIRLLSLANNQITNKGLTHICQMLRINNSLQDLWVNANDQISNWTELACAIEEANLSLVSLDWNRRDHMDPTVFKALLERNRHAAARLLPQVAQWAMLFSQHGVLPPCELSWTLARLSPLHVDVLLEVVDQMPLFRCLPHSKKIAVITGVYKSVKLLRPKSDTTDD